MCASPCSTRHARTQLTPPSHHLHFTIHTNSRFDLLHRLGSAAADAPALLTETFGPLAWGDPHGQVALAVDVPSPDGYGPCVKALNPAFMQRFASLQEIHVAFLQKRTLHFAVSALYVSVCSFFVCSFAVGWVSWGV